MKNFIKAVVFIIIFVIIWNNVFSVLWLEKNSVYYFFEEPENSLDVVYVGSSNVYAHFNNLLAYEEYGFTTGLLSTDSQPFVLIKYLIEESQKTQSPELYIIDIAKIADGNDYIEEAGVRKVTDMLSFSPVRFNALSQVLSLSQKDKISEEDYPSYYLSYLKYHSTWKEIDEGSYNVTRLYKGYLFDTTRTNKVSQTKYEWIDTSSDLLDDNEEILLQLLDYIEQNELNVLFVIPSRYFSEDEMGYLNTAKNIIESYDYEVINFNKEEFGLDYSTDFYNAAHINVYGATKYTLYFSEYLNENYSLTDHRGGGALYDSWDSEYERFKESYYELTGNDFEELVNNYKLFFT